jgi:hypothetical protein
MRMTPCPACGVPNAGSYTFCQQCGQRLAAGAPTQRLPTWALAAVMLTGLFLIAFLGHWLGRAEADAASYAEVANLAARVPAGWQVELQEPDQIYLGSDQVIVLMSSGVQSAAVNLETAVTRLSAQLQQANPAAQICATEAAPLPGIAEPGWLVRLCGTGPTADRTIVLIVAVSADGLAYFGLMVETTMVNVEQAMQVVQQEIAPGIRWKLAAGGEL